MAFFLSITQKRLKKNFLNSMQKNNLNFVIDSSNWLFKYKNGWYDYFAEIKLKYVINKNNNKEIIVKHPDVLFDYKIYEYVENKYFKGRIAVRR